MTDENPAADWTLCGLWVNPGEAVHLYWRDSTGQVAEEQEDFSPYLWTRVVPEDIPDTDLQITELEGKAPLDKWVEVSDAKSYFSWIRGSSNPQEVEVIRVLENQYLLRKHSRLFSNFKFESMRRMQVDIETGCEVEGGFSDPGRKGDRVLAIGMQQGEKREILELEDDSDAAERNLLKAFCEVLEAWDPDILEGHNLFSFDLNFLYRRSKRFRLAPVWGRFGQEARTRNSRLRVAERWLDYTRFDIPGRSVFDTYLMIQVFDVTTRDLPSYRLKDVARYLGVTPADGEGRTYIEGNQIESLFYADRDTFRRYLEDDLRETAGIAEILLPTYIAQAQNIPMTLQEICLRGTAQKIDTLFLEKYLEAGHSLPAPERQSGSYEGGYTKSFEIGVFEHVLHYDVASLYPSILLHLNKNPTNDPLGAFIPLLENLRDYRLHYKNLAREESDPSLKREYQARQASFKILINSFYGYLGFPGARFGDPDLAAEVTAQGREYLKALIAEFQNQGCTVLEADTDGIYVSSREDWNQPEALLERVKNVLPEGIDLEYDGAYQSMFCYKAKNYALYDGEKVTIRGSALRSRGMEPYLKSLTHLLINFLLGVTGESPRDRIADYEAALDSGTMPVEELVKSEYLSMSPEAYQKKMEKGGKPRRAALEVALASDRQKKTGDSVSYFVGPGAKGKTAAWQRASALEDFHPESNPYDPKYYRKKLKDWLKRYDEFLAETDEKDPG